MRNLRLRLIVGTLILALLGAVPAYSRLTSTPAQVCDEPGRTIELFASYVNKKRTKIGYGLERGKPTVPGPTIETEEGECIAVTLTNDTREKVGLHAHGVGYTPSSDGTPLNRSCVGAGKSRTYVFEAETPGVRADGSVNPGSAGYWHYHDHCNGTTHGTFGVRKGLFGALIVRRAGDPVPDKTFVLVMSGFQFNLKRAPKTPLLEANIGQRVEFVVITHGELHHTFHLHGHRWSDNRTGIPDAPGDSTQIIDNRTTGPGDSFGFQVVAGEGVGQGAWMYHCHVQHHSDAGMEGLFVVLDENGEMDEQTAKNVARWKGHKH